MLALAAKSAGNSHHQVPTRHPFRLCLGNCDSWMPLFSTPSIIAISCWGRCFDENLPVLSHFFQSSKSSEARELVPLTVKAKRGVVDSRLHSPRGCNLDEIKCLFQKQYLVPIETGELEKSLEALECNHLP